MLKLTGIKKDYITASETVHALKGIDLYFRHSEFVSVLGPSGCGKTTLLNIIGGLDHYTDGDLLINGTSTKFYGDKDWDVYRNHRIGFIFQSYNLIPHQTILGNVELALTIAGISKEERVARAKEALDRVGLAGQYQKRPNQLSGGQCQRVAIARALVNNPEILLADEPTGALDSETSVQVMELLKEIANDRLVIMVTHNPELAKEYSTRIITLKDGCLVDDSNPYSGEMTYEELKKAYEKKVTPKKTKASVSLWTAISLSFNNLMTKKGRTFLTSFAGSIGIIGIALILAVSTGVNAYIQSIERDAMSSYPIQIQRSTMNPTAAMAAFMQNAASDNQQREPGKVYSSQIMAQMLSTTSDNISTNNLQKFKEYIDEHKEEFLKYCTDIKYSYSANLNAYLLQEDGSYKNSTQGMERLYASMGITGVSKEMMNTMMSMMGSMGSVTGWTEMVGSTETIMEEYKLVDGRYPEKNNEIVLIVDENNRISDYTLYILGIRDSEEIKEYMKHLLSAQISGTPVDYEIPSTEYTFEEIYNFKFKVLLDSDHYVLENGLIRKLNVDNEDDKQILNQRIEEAVELEIVGIVCPTSDSMSMTNIGTIGYMSHLMDDVIQKINDSDVVQAQLNNKDIDLFTGINFDSKGMTFNELPDVFKNLINSLPEDGYTDGLDEILEKINIPMLKEIILQAIPQNREQLISVIMNYINADRITENTYSGNLKKLGYVDISTPSSISIYPKDFEAKEMINAMIAEYNTAQGEKDKITYTDTVAILMGSVTTIVDAISYVLIAFVAISLVVSSIMIGVITYISVLERTKEIGVLRSIGASKRDISLVFNAETMLVGLVAGVIGILSSLGLIVIINIILNYFTGIETLKAVLEPAPAITLIAISVALTLIAGLSPAKAAANKDPVVALRTE